jgi:hypothetical protein
MAFGVATVIGRIVVVATAPSDESIDASTTLRAALGVGPGSFSLGGCSDPSGVTAPRPVDSSGRGVCEDE